MQKLLFFLLISTIVFAFDKNLMRKGKRDPTEKHPISRRVLRFERSVADDFDVPYPVIDFAKIIPELPSKIKNTNLPTEYADMDF